MSPLAELHARMREMTINQKEAHTSLLMRGEPMAAAHAWETYQEAKDVTTALAALLQPDADLSDI